MSINNSPSTSTHKEVSNTTAFVYVVINVQLTIIGAVVAFVASGFPAGGNATTMALFIVIMVTAFLTYFSTHSNPDSALRWMTKIYAGITSISIFIASAKMLNISLDRLVVYLAFLAFFAFLHSVVIGIVESSSEGR